MAKIVSTFFISLDGVVESPDKWHFPYMDDRMGAAIGADEATTTGYLMGRKLYEEWVAYWPSQGDDEPFASFINGVAKHVVSNTLTSADWNNTSIISGDVTGQLQHLKDTTDGVIGMFGSATLVRSLLADGLLDELQLFVHPIAVGRGQRLFEDTPTHPLRLLRHDVFPTGVLHLVYGPDATT